ncbi:ABC transporter ATP-binding protein [Roseateles cellulosilyticus]|uniref:ABC transporter ATP-binding protein n=1 Tax=Pelomonas cellulosilytica TaxID=2906762 RepID=A0ABS8XZQ6_9BURK|nr:ABC transporter ATP-binding protein [Pelomonas sp. P8]MCE4556302.1 ABC transporter ATP-binding protein [Pelomonas sp. P8]
MADPVVRLVGVKKAFNVGTPVETEVLHGIDLQLAAGEFCAVMGPSGSGKSTLLNLVGLLDRPTAGQLFIQGLDTGTLDDAGLTRLRGRSIGFVFQYHHLISAFTALENVMLPLLGQRGFPDDAMRVRAAELLDAVGLAAFADHPADRLSGGQQQRVAVARALALRPPLLLADEPTGNLDTRSAEAVFTLLRRFSAEAGTAVFFVTHNPELARRCDRTIEVVDGRIAAVPD